MLSQVISSVLLTMERMNSFLPITRGPLMCSGTSSLIILSISCILRCKQLSSRLDIFLSHDWPVGVSSYGDENKLLRTKPFFEEDVRAGKLGSPASRDLLMVSLSLFPLRSSSLLSVFVLFSGSLLIFTLLSLLSFSIQMGKRRDSSLWISLSLGDSSSRLVFSPLFPALSLLFFSLSTWM